MNYQYLNEINNYNTVEGLAGWLAKVIVRFSDLVFDLRDVKHADAIYQTIQYINKNFAEKVTLDEVASSVYLSPAYFSKIFKEEMKCNFNTYLNQVRISKSKNLLMNSKFSLVEIARNGGLRGPELLHKGLQEDDQPLPRQVQGKTG